LHYEALTSSLHQWYKIIELFAHIHQDLRMNYTDTGHADLHMHTTASDGTTPVRDLLSYVAQHRPDLDVIAITDHDTLDAALWAYEHRHYYPFDIVPGIEVSSRGGHVLALWVTTLIPAKLSLEETVIAIHEAGGLAVLAHPLHIEMDVVRANARRYWRTPTVLSEAGLDALEAHNAAVGIPGTNWMARILATRAGLPMTGGSDAHTLGAIGSGSTRFPGTSGDDLRRAILNRQIAAEGSTWHIREYIAYLQHDRRRKAMQSLA
jgi:predicted metal-dependent phosphoesterase TrpH